MRNRNVRVPAAVVPRQSRIASIASSYIWVPFFQQGSTAAKTAIRGNVANIPSELDIVGTTTNIWDEKGVIDAGVATTGDNYIQVKNSAFATAMQSVLRLDTLGDGGILIAFDIQTAANPSGNEYLWSVSPASTSGGGYGVYISSFGNLINYMKMASNGTGAIVASNAITSFHGARLSVVTYLDGSDRTWDTWFNGVGKTAGSWHSGSAPYLEMSMNGMAWFARSTATPDNIVGSTNGNEIQMSNFMAFRFASGFSAYAAEFADEFYKYRREMPSVVFGR